MCIRDSQKTNKKSIESKVIPAEYKVNKEISYIASIAIRKNLPLAPIQIPPCDTTSVSTSLPFPTIVISIRAPRLADFKNRLVDNTFSNLYVLPGTDGHSRSLDELRHMCHVTNFGLKHGEIGCFDSHTRALQRVVKENWPMAIIAEDDVNFTGSLQQNAYLAQLLKECHDRKKEFDILYLSWFRPDSPLNKLRTVTPHTRRQWTFCQLWAYVVTARGAQKLLNSRHMKHAQAAVDVAYFHAATNGDVNSLVAYPPLCLTVGASSDTALKHRTNNTNHPVKAKRTNNINHPMKAKRFMENIRRK